MGPSHLETFWLSFLEVQPFLNTSPWSLLGTFFPKAYFANDFSRMTAVFVRQMPKGHMVSIDFSSRLALFSDFWSELI